MAIYHLHAKVISRANGSSALASAAYRSASRLHDERLDRDHDFSNKAGVIHSEVLAPDHTPPEHLDREQLWNVVEAIEKRKDAQLSREIEFAIPRELSQEDGIALAREFVQDEFVSKGMIADLNVHWDIGADGQAKPHAHVMLTTRSVDENGFGAKVRDWNRVEHLERWRESWATHANERLAELGIDVRIDHRTLKEQGIDLEPQDKIGPAASRMVDDGLELERIEHHRAVARENGDKIIANADLALDAITKQQATFTERDLAKFVHRHSDGLEQYNQVLGSVHSSPSLVRLGLDRRGEDRFTSREMLEVEQRLHNQAQVLAEREGHVVRAPDAKRALEGAEARGLVLSREQRAAFEHVVGRGDLGVVLGYAGSGKSAMLGVAREAFEEAGYTVRGMALSGIAAENLESGSGIASRTIASHEYHWAQGRELLTDKDVLVIDEAGMVGTRQLERVMGHAERAGAKVILVGDPEQLQAIDAGAAFRSIGERHAHVEVQEIRRQRDGWQRDATRHLATERTEQALDAYRDHGMVHVADSREHARQELIDSWDKDRLAAPEKSRLILTHTNDEVRTLNEMARARLRASNQLGDEVALTVERGERAFASGDRVMFLKNERSLGVKNGTLGIVEQVSQTHMEVRLDTGHSVAFDLKDYNQIDHGYSATVHKSQGVTVDRTHVLATRGLDRHASYVALSRHRDWTSLHYGTDDFANEAKLTRTLSRERAKDMASDYGPEIVQSRAPIRPEKPVPEPTPTRAPTPPRGMFDGLDLSSRKARDRVTTEFGGARQGLPRDPFQDIRIPAHSPKTPRVQPDRDPAERIGHLQGAESYTTRQRNLLVQRYAEAELEIADARRKGINPSLETMEARKTARHGLERLEPGAGQDIAAAFARYPSMAAETARGQTQRAIQAMQIESEIRLDPQARAERFVRDWNHHAGQRRAFEAAGDYQRAIVHADRQRSMGETLQRDPQLDSILRIQRELTRAMGIGRGDIDIGDYLGRSRSRGIER